MPVLFAFVAWLLAIFAAPAPEVAPTTPTTTTMPAPQAVNCPASGVETSTSATVYPNGNSTLSYTNTYCGLAEYGTTWTPPTWTLP